MRCADCGEDVKESERRAAVTCCDCGAVMHHECAMGSVYLVKDYCEPCYYARDFDKLKAPPSEEEREPFRTPNNGVPPAQRAYEVPEDETFTSLKN